MQESPYNPFEDAELVSRPPHRLDAIEGVVRRIVPLEAEVAGPRAIRHAAAGGSAERLEGGRHADFMQLLGDLSAITTLIQAAIMLRTYLRSKRVGSDDLAGQRHSVDSQVLREALERALAESLPAQEHVPPGLLQRRPNLLRDVVEALPDDGD